MRFVLVAAIVFGLCITQCMAQDSAPPEASPTAAAALWPALPVRAETPDYIGTSSQEPLRPVRKTAPGKFVTPPVAIVAPVGPLPPPALPTPKFEQNAPAALTLVYPAAGTGVNEGDGLFVWNTGGPIAYVRLSYSGENCRLGGSSRGTFNQTLGKVANKGTYKWAVPYMDASEFKLHLVGYGVDGKQLAATEGTFQLRPRYLQDKPETCLVVSKARQRLWYLKDGLIRRMHLVSTAAGGYTTPNMHPGSYDRQRGAMGRVFGKDYAPMSRMYHVVMYYWLQITSSGSHGIHSTSPPFYSALGGPASHGCIRQHRSDARILWGMVNVGTPVYVQ